MSPLLLALLGDAVTVNATGLADAVNAGDVGAVDVGAVGALDVVVGAIPADAVDAIPAGAVGALQATPVAVQATPLDAVTLAASFGVDQIAVLTIGGVAVVLGLFGAWYGLRLRRHGYKGEGGGTLDRDRAERERNLAAAEAKRAAKAARKRG